MFHLVAFGATTGAGGGTTDLTMFTDSEMSSRNGHLFLSEQFNVVAMSVLGAQVTNANLLAPTLNAVTQFSIWPIQPTITPGSPPKVDLWFDFPVRLPTNEEIQVQVTTNAVADQVTALLWLAEEGWTQKIPRGIPPVPIFDMKFTASPTGVLNAWSAPVAVTLAQNLRQGTYAVVGMECQGTNSVATRINFPSAYIYRGRKLRPGVINSNALGDHPATFGQKGPLVFGPFGQFTNAELPLVEVAAAAAGAITLQGRMRLVRLREDMDVDYGR